MTTDDSGSRPWGERRELSDGFVLLRLPTVADIPAIVNICNEPDVIAYTSVPSPYDASTAREFLARVDNTWRAGTAASFAVCSALAPEELLGMIGLQEFDLDGVPGGVAGVGYWLAGAARGQGLMTAAVRVLCEWGFSECGLARITWEAVAGNDASRAVAQRVGFTYEGTLRSWMLHRGHRVDAWIGGLLPGEILAPPIGDGPTERPASAGGV